MAQRTRSKSIKKTSTQHSEKTEQYLTLKEMITSGADWFKKDYNSCPSTLKRIIEMGLYSTCLICLGAVWAAYFHCCNCTIDNSKISQSKVSMVLYQNGRAFISQTRKMDLKLGLQNISFGTVPQQLIVPSATVSGQNIHMQSVNFKPADEHHSYFEHAQTQAIGKNVTLLWEVWKDGKKTELTKPVQLLASEGSVPVLLIDGKVQKGTDAKILYPTPSKQENNQPELTFTVLSDSKKPQMVDFSYMSSGFSWQAFYNLYLDENKHTMDIQGQVNLVNKSGVTYKNVNLDFVLGDIHTLEYYTPRRAVDTCSISNNSGRHIASDKLIVNGEVYENTTGREVYSSREAANGYSKYALDGAVMSAKALSYERTLNKIRDLKDYYVYHVPVPVQLNQDSPTMATFLNGKGIPYHKEYTFKNLIFLGSGNENRNIAPNLNLVFNTQKLGLPLPKGDFRVFNKQKGHTFFVGESSVNKITMPNQEARVSMGDALDVYADSYLIGYKNISDVETLYTYEIDIKNLSKEAKDISIEQNLKEGEFILKQTQLAPIQATPAKIKWQVVLQPQGKQMIVFSILHRNLELIRKKEEMKFKEDLCKHRSVVVNTANK